MSKTIFTFISDKIIESFEWTDELGTIEWCKDNIYLTSDVSPNTGFISYDKYPWAEEILEDWDKDWIEQYTIEASTQVAKTTIQFSALSKSLDTDPCMIQFTIPNDKGVPDFIKTKFDPFFNGIKSLKDKLNSKREEEKSRLAGAIKEVPGGMLFILGNTDANRRSKTVKYMFIDEAALFGKGHIKELIGRTKSFENKGRKIFIVSSRKYKGDEIEIEYDNSYCKKELMIMCKKCGEYFHPGSKHFKWMSKKEYKEKHGLKSIENVNNYKREAKETARVQCECGHDIDYEELVDLIREKKVKLILVEGEDSDSKHGYKLNALATGLTKYSTIAEALIEADDETEEMQTIYQDYFNETYEVVYEDKEASDMFLLNSGVPEWVVPKDTVAIYLTIDNQMDHLYAQITAIQYGMKVHIVMFDRIESWSQAEQLWEICQNLEGEDGTTYMASKMGIDRRGYNIGEIRRTDEADEFVQYMTSKWGEDRIYGMEGHPEIRGGKSFTVGRHKDESNQRRKIDIKVVKFSNLYIKNKLFKYIDRQILKSRAEEDTEEYGYDEKLLFINSTNIERDMESITDHSLTRMLTAEVWGKAIDPKTRKEAKTESWIPIRKRNDAIDTTGMAISLSDMDMVSMMQKPEEVDVSSSLKRLDF